MSDNLQKLYISLFSQSDSRTHLCYVRIPVFTVWKVFGSHVFSNKRRLTGNRPGSERRETGRKKLLPQHLYLKWTRVLAKIDSSTEARVLVRSPNANTLTVSEI